MRARTWHPSLGYSTAPGLRNLEQIIAGYADDEQPRIRELADGASAALDTLERSLAELLDAVDADEAA